jgi:hypothetical protein
MGLLGKKIPPDIEPPLTGDQPPLGFFRLILNGEKYLAFNHAAYGLRAPVKIILHLGGQTFVRDMMMPLPIWEKKIVRVDGAFVRGDARIYDSTKLEEFDGEFSYDPIR